MAESDQVRLNSNACSWKSLKYISTSDKSGQTLEQAITIEIHRNVQIKKYEVELHSYYMHKTRTFMYGTLHLQ